MSEQRKMELEQSIIGMMLSYPEMIPVVQSLGVAKEKLHSRHGIIYDAILRCYLDGQVPTPDVVANRLGVNDVAKARSFLQKLAARVSSGNRPNNNLEYYVNEWSDMYMRHKVKEMAKRTIVDLDNNKTLDEVKSIWFDSLFLDQDTSSVHTGVRLRDGLVEYLHELQMASLLKDEESAKVTPTGIPSLDRMLNGGFRQGTLTYVAGRPSNGKSTFLLNLALNAALDFNIGSALFTLEMPLDELMMVLLSTISEKLFPNEGVESQRLEMPESLEYEDWKKLVRAIEYLKDAPLHVVDCDGATITDIGVLSTMYNRQGVDSFYIDYWQLIRTAKGTMPEKEYEFAETSEGLRRLAKSIDSKLIVGAQVSRSNDLKDNKLPTMRDIRNSGKAEQDAHRVLTLHFPEKYAESPELCDRPNELDVGIMKNRRGGTGKVTLYFKKEWGFLEDLNPAWSPSSIPTERRGESFVSTTA